jgi:hypothetical protein
VISALPSACVRLTDAYWSAVCSAAVALVRGRVVPTATPSPNATAAKVSLETGHRFAKVVFFAQTLAEINICCRSRSAGIIFRDRADWSAFIVINDATSAVTACNMHPHRFSLNALMGSPRLLISVEPFFISARRGRNRISAGGCRAESPRADRTLPLRNCRLEARYPPFVNSPQNKQDPDTDNQSYRDE